MNDWIKSYVVCAGCCLSIPPSFFSLENYCSQAAIHSHRTASFSHLNLIVQLLEQSEAFRLLLDILS